ncbi:hypothetical protein C8R45DRAFT_1114050 [Mycena sanguinolenta]|nr:hypothetical protein C8R45DRAFT_1114050 [Mycena sanguinolenta]
MVLQPEYHHALGSALRLCVVLEWIDAQTIHALRVASLFPRSDPRRITQAHSEIHVYAPRLRASNPRRTTFRTMHFQHRLDSATPSLLSPAPSSPSPARRRRHATLSLSPALIVTFTAQTYLPACESRQENLPPPTRTRCHGACVREIPPHSSTAPGFCPSTPPSPQYSPNRARGRIPPIQCPRPCRVPPAGVLCIPGSLALEPLPHMRAHSAPTRRQRAKPLRLLVAIVRSTTSAIAQMHTSAPHTSHTPHVHSRSRATSGSPSPRLLASISLQRLRHVTGGTTASRDESPVVRFDLGTQDPRRRTQHSQNASLFGFAYASRSRRTLRLPVASISGRHLLVFRGDNLCMSTLEPQTGGCGDEGEIVQMLRDVSCALYSSWSFFRMQSAFRLGMRQRTCFTGALLTTQPSIVRHFPIDVSGAVLLAIALYIPSTRLPRARRIHPGVDAGLDLETSRQYPPPFVPTAPPHIHELHTLEAR